MTNSSHRRAVLLPSQHNHPTHSAQPQRHLPLEAHRVRQILSVNHQHQLSVSRRVVRRRLVALPVNPRVPSDNRASVLNLMPVRLVNLRNLLLSASPHSVNLLLLQHLNSLLLGSPPLANLQTLRLSNLVSEQASVSQHSQVSLPHSALTRAPLPVESLARQHQHSGQDQALESLAASQTMHLRIRLAHNHQLQSQKRLKWIRPDLLPAQTHSERTLLSLLHLLHPVALDKQLQPSLLWATLASKYLDRQAKVVKRKSMLSRTPQ